MRGNEPQGPFIPPGQTPAVQTPRGQTPPRADTPRDGYCIGRYASYWNAFLLLFVNGYILPLLIVFFLF